MYNPLLDVFICVADAGSFNKAAEATNITKNAIIKQINVLEAELGVKLFTRTPRGVILTRAGNRLYNDSKFVIQYCKNSVILAKNETKDTENVIRIGSSSMMSANNIIKMWTRIQQHLPDVKFKIIPFENMSDRTKEVLRNLEHGIDVVAGVYGDKLPDKRKCTSLEIGREPICCVVPIYHHLADKNNLVVEDLYGEKLMLIRRGWSSEIDRLRDYLWEKHRKIRVTDYDVFETDIYRRCEREDAIIVMPEGMVSFNPMFKAIPVEWGFEMTVRMFYSSKPSEMMQEFVDVVEQIV